MDARDLLLEQTRHHYRWLERATRDVDEVRARWSPGPGRPSIAWQVAHLIEQVESSVEALTGRSRPTDALPDGALRERWRETSARALAALEGLAPDDLAAAPLVPLHPDFEDTLRSRSRWWSGHVFHVAYHLGQVGSLRAAQGLGWESPDSEGHQGPATGT